MATGEEDLQRGELFLSAVRDRFAPHKTAEALRWLSEIKQMQTEHPTETKTIIGVIGDTGAGKSALINALLDEERILPTNCMRACTAVVTEISYNTSTIPYRAEVEFITEDQWEKELEALLGDLLDSNGNISGNSSREDTEAGVAYAKVKAVYPDLDKDAIVQSKVKKLMAHSSCIHLGKTELIEDTDPIEFCRRLHVYIDSREKVDLRLKSTKTATNVLQFWPLIKVVRVYVKAALLQAGFVIVDLPGVQDSNAARAAIAQDYIKQCNGMFIVAPINRAVDNKSAKTMLGQSFKQQLKLDGNFGNITWICSQTDAITRTEAISNLDLTAQIQPLQKELEDLELKKTQLDKNLPELFESQRLAHDTHAAAQSDLGTYHRLLRRSEKGLFVSKGEAPVASKKRKLTLSSTSVRKKQDMASNMRNRGGDGKTTDSSFEYNVEDIDNFGESDNEEDEAVLETEEIRQKIAELQDIKLASEKNIKELARSIKGNRTQKPQLEEEEARIDNQITKVCIGARNDYARRAIQADFATGIQELDMELAAENDPDNFDPEKPLRDYDEVAKNLPVFCVCSRGYQKLCGRLKKDHKVSGFENTEDTEIPQLQAHCRNIAQLSRSASIARHLTKIELLSNSLKIWISGANYQHDLDDYQMQSMNDAVKIDLANVIQALGKVSEKVINAVLQNIDGYIWRRLPIGSKKAQKKSLEIVNKWGSPVNKENREQGGLHFMTYKATVRRDGYFAKETAVHDFNEQLCEPLVTYLAHGWEKVFVRALPAAFTEATKEVEQAVHIFRTKITATAIRFGIPHDLTEFLEKQLKAHVQNAKEALSCAKEAFTKGQKGINRQFKTQIEQHMTPLYIACASNCGPGSFNRMRHAMEYGLRDCNEIMFEDCSDFIEQKLRDLLQKVDEGLQRKTKQITAWIQRDCMLLSVDRSKQILAEEELLKETLTLCIDEFERKTQDEEVIEIAQPEQALEIKQEVNQE